MNLGGGAAVQRRTEGRSLRSIPLACPCTNVPSAGWSAQLPSVSLTRGSLAGVGSWGGGGGLKASEVL